LISAGDFPRGPWEAVSLTAAILLLYFPSRPFCRAGMALQYGNTATLSSLSLLVFFVFIFSRQFTVYVLYVLFVNCDAAKNEVGCKDNNFRSCDKQNDRNEAIFSKLILTYWKRTNKDGLISLSLP